MFCFALFRSFLIVYTIHALNYFYKSITTCRSANNLIFLSFTRIVLGEFTVGVEYQGNRSERKGTKERQLVCLK